MRAKLESAWKDTEKGRTAAVCGILAGYSAFRTLRNARRKLRDMMQAAEDRCVEMYTGGFEQFTKAGDMRGWNGHLKGRWGLPGN